MMQHDNKKKSIQGSLTECLVLTLLTFFIWSVTCVDKGIWPFGRMLLDVGDMMEQVVPMYTHLWDVLHGQKSLLFDWYTGLGNNMIGSDLHFGLVSPFNIFFFFVKRSAIEASMSVYILIKLIAIGFSVRFVLKKWFPELSVWMYLSFSLLYVFSAFNMQYYYATMWLDLAFMFPLVMYGYFLLMNEKKCVFYIVCLSIACMMSFQHTFMLFMMLLFLTGFLPFLSREKYQKSLIRLLAATLIALLMAAWILLPAAIQILTSDRKELNYSLVEIWNSIWVFMTAKWVKLLNMGIPLSFFLIYAAKHYKEKAVRFFCFVLFIICAPICLESTNILWHGGLYQGYTMRFAYMLTFWILAAGAYACEKYNAEIQLGKKERKSVHSVIGVLSLLLLIVVTGVQYNLLKGDMTDVYKKGVPAIAIILIVAVNIAGGILCRKEKIYEKLLLVIIILQSFTLTETMIIPTIDRDNSFFSIGSEAAEQESADNSNPIVRLKSLDVTLSHNYPFIIQKNASSCYLNVNSTKQMAGSRRLGYAKVGYRISDYGGTLFSDALLGMKEAISSVEVNKDLYEYQNTYGDYSIYKCLYGYGQGIRFKNAASVEDNYDIEENPFLYQNRIAEELVGSELLDVTFSDGNEAALSIGEKSIVYLYADTEKSFETVKVTDTNTKEEYTLVLHESGWMNGILELGTWENAALTIQITAKEPVGEVSYAVLPLQRFIDNEPEYFENYMINRRYSTLSISLDEAKGSEYLFLPVYHDNGWKCSVNGQKTKIEDFAHFLMAIPLQEGKNEIKLSYVPVGLYSGMLLSVLGIILFIIFCKYPMQNEYERAGRVLWILNELLFAALMVLFYFMPIIFFVKEPLRMIVG